MYAKIHAPSALQLSPASYIRSEAREVESILMPMSFGNKCLFETCWCLNIRIGPRISRRLVCAQREVVMSCAIGFGEWYSSAVAHSGTGLLVPATIRFCALSTQSPRTAKPSRKGNGGRGYAYQTLELSILPTIQLCERSPRDMRQSGLQSGRTIGSAAGETGTREQFLCRTRTKAA